MPELADRLRRFPISMIGAMIDVANQYNAVSLVQGSPDFDPPAELLTAAVRAVEQAANHQYSMPIGSPRFRAALASKQSRLMGLDIDPETQITATVGTSEAVITALLAVCNPGDRVLAFSPYYENYAPGAWLAGAEIEYVPLYPPNFCFDPDELRRAFQRGVKALALCNPSNPCGKVFTRAELEIIAGLAQEYDVFVIADEVYEHIVYPPHRHTYIASLPGMFERTISCGSLSKTYVITGWRLGYAIAPAPVSRAIRTLHEYLTICPPAPLQEAAAAALSFSDAYYQQMLEKYIHLRSVFLGCLDRAGIGYTEPQGAYYVMADISPFGFEDDVAFCYWLAREIGVGGVPGSSFFHEPVRHLVRFTFAKREETLLEAGRRLMKLQSYRK